MFHLDQTDQSLRLYDSASITTVCDIKELV